MSLDSLALENLEVIHDADGKVAGQLSSSLGHFVTPFARDFQRNGSASLGSESKEIQDRQDAVQYLLTTAAGAACKMRNTLRTVRNLERALSRLHSSSLQCAHAGRDADHVILDEDPTKKKVTAFVSAFTGRKAANTNMAATQEVHQNTQVPC